MELVSTLKFWANNSYEHIEVLQNAYKTVGATLQPSFQQELQILFNAFKNIDSQIDNDKIPTNLDNLYQLFMDNNQVFIELLENLKFDGYNGYPVLFETVQHFIYEQLYAIQVLSKGYAKMYEEQLFTLDFILGPIKIQKQNMFSTTLNTNVTSLIGATYFWSLISAEHTSIIANVSPIESNLPVITTDLLTKLRSAFNHVNYALSNIDKIADGFISVVDNFLQLNDSFLIMLNNFKVDDSKFVPNSIKKDLPPLFDGVLNHIIHEQERAGILINALKQNL
ncbi:MAG: hypothetical protein BEN18_03975 [Epulopiscium sp. Nuni2H_MBin001]|nr:MAG: hypothetical protein BEN18_03975 [Epulopiscium sp. Nuni2H_MBin001]